MPVKDEIRALLRPTSSTGDVWCAIAANRLLSPDTRMARLSGSGKVANCPQVSDGYVTI
jgi:hypothetical protein